MRSEEMAMDDLLEKIACDLEGPMFLDFLGIAARRKRDREDADLRFRVRQEQRREIAGWIRSFKSGEGNDLERFLREVGNGEAGQFEWGPDVAVAVLSGLVVVHAEIAMSTHLPNCETKFRYSLTDAGKARLKAVSAAVSAASNLAADASA
jgi:hypothetical protein